MEKIEKLKHWYLRNTEFTRAIPHLVAIIDKYSCVKQHLGNRFEAVKGFLPALDKIEVQERSWQEAKVLDEEERARDAFVNTIIRTERNYARVVVPGYENASELLTALFDKHGRDIAYDRNIAETQRIYNLTKDVERTPGMLEALDALALTPVYNAMKEANKHFDELWQQRNKDFSEVEHVDSKAIRADCGKAIVALYEGIEYWATESEDADWQRLIAELSQLGSYYNQQIKARITRRKNKKSSEDEPQIQPPS